MNNNKKIPLTLITIALSAVCHNSLAELVSISRESAIHLGGNNLPFPEVNFVSTELYGVFDHTITRDYPSVHGMVSHQSSVTTSGFSFAMSVDLSVPAPYPFVYISDLTNFTLSFYVDVPSRLELSGQWSQLPDGSFKLVRWSRNGTDVVFPIETIFDGHSGGVLPISVDLDPAYAYVMSWGQTAGSTPYTTPPYLPFSMNASFTGVVSPLSVTNQPTTNVPFPTATIWLLGMALTGLSLLAKRGMGS